MKYIMLLFTMFVASSAFAGGFQSDLNSARTNYIPYHKELQDLVFGLSGVPKSTLPPSVQAKMQNIPANNALAGDPLTLQAQNLQALAANAYVLFANNGWTAETLPRTQTDTAALGLRQTTTTYLRIKGSNSFTGETYDSGEQVLSTSSGYTFMGNLLLTGATIALYLL